MENQEQAMTLEAFRAAKESGVNLYDNVQQEDAAPEQVIEHEESQDIEIEQDSHEPEQDVDPDPIPQEHQSAWAKRAERERRKAAEETETRLKAEYEAQINPYKAFFDKLGVKPEDALQVMEQNRMRQEAENLAYANGWTDEQAQMYMQNQQNQKEMRDLRVSVQINDLADTADYPGIKQMKAPISDYISRNPAATVTEAYYAVGGQSLVQQIKREAEQREIAKRSTAPRKVVSDAPSNNKGPEPLTTEAVAFMKRTGMSEAKFREQYMGEGPKNLEEFRKMNKKG